MREGVLIPRPETETLVETIIEAIKTINNPHILDLCTGTGCIGLSLKKYIKDSCVDLCDISAEALKLAEENKRDLQFADGVRIFFMDVLKKPSDIGLYDCICANPPYIESDEIETLMPEILYEPRLALDGGKDGYQFYRAIIDNFYESVKPGGILAFEAGQGQADKIKELMLKRGLYDISTVNDYAGISRVVAGRRQC